MFPYICQYNKYKRKYKEINVLSTDIVNGMYAHMYQGCAPAPMLILDTTTIQCKIIIAEYQFPKPLSEFPLSRHICNKVAEYILHI